LKFIKVDIFVIQPERFFEKLKEKQFFTKFLLKDENIIQTPILIDIKISKKQSIIKTIHIY